MKCESLCTPGSTLSNTLNMKEYHHFDGEVTLIFWHPAFTTFLQSPRFRAEPRPTAHSFFFLYTVMALLQLCLFCSSLQIGSNLPSEFSITGAPWRRTKGPAKQQKTDTTSMWRCAAASYSSMEAVRETRTISRRQRNVKKCVWLKVSGSEIEGAQQGQTEVCTSSGWCRGWQEMGFRIRVWIVMTMMDKRYSFKLHKTLKWLILHSTKVLSNVQLGKKQRNHPVNTEFFFRNSEWSPQLLISAKLITFKWVIPVYITCTVDINSLIIRW